jgi:radical SAM protein with 4Fe4S-binding SPASM domain
VADLQLENFCSAPWTSLYVNTDGRVDNCCISNNNLGNLDKNNLTEIIQGNALKDIKKNMSNNQLVTGCKACLVDNKHKDNFQNFFNKQYANDEFVGSEDQFILKYLDLRWNNTCNLACIYCSDMCSSLWADINSKKSDPNVIPIKTKSYKHQEELISLIKKYANDLEHLYLAGGEPLLIKENTDVLNLLVDADNTQCRIIVNSNILNLKTPVFEKLTQMNNVQWLVSAESIGEMYEYIRWPALWNTFYSNLQILKTLKNHSISVNCVGMNLNALEIWNFIDLLKADFDIDHSDISINVYNHRDTKGPWTPHRLTESVKIKVVELSKKYHRVLGIDNYIQSLYDTNTDDLANLEITKRSLAELDLSRGLDSSKIFTHL